MRRKNATNVYITTRLIKIYRSTMRVKCIKDETDRLLVKNVEIKNR
jgi:hypothetical protein